MAEYNHDLSDPTLPAANPSGEGVALRIVSSLGTRVLTWEGLAWFALTLAAGITRFWNLGARVMSHDESLHVYYSWLYSTGSLYTHNPMMHGPFLFEATALFDRLFGGSDFTSRILPALMGIGIVVGIPLLLRPWLGRWGAGAAGIILLVSPYVLFYSRYNRHDILEIGFALLAAFAILAYLRSKDAAAPDRVERWLLLLAGAEAMMFATMETAFIYVAIFASFLLLKLLAENGLRWQRIRRAAEFDLLVIMATLGAFFSSPIALLALNPLWQALTGQPFVPLTVFSTYGIEWATGASGPRIIGLLVAFGAAAVLVGLWWNWRRWLKAAAIFLALTVVLFTTFGLNRPGFGTGFIGSLGYWLSQHGVARGGQPDYYYLIVFPLYEYLPLIGGLAAIIFLAAKRRQLTRDALVFGLFAAWWAFWILAGLSVAGEKMPWLSTHITVPFILLTGWLVGQMVPRMRLEAAQTGGRPAGWVVGLVLLAGLFGLTVRTSYLVNYLNYDYTTEFVGYAHGAPGIRWTVEDIEKIARQTGEGKNLQIAYDSQVSWPMTWYLRGHPGFFGDQPNRGAVENAPVIVVGSQNWDKTEALLGPDYNRYEVIRMWWPMEDYKNLTLDRIRGALTDPQMRQAVWDILWARDYRRFAALTDQPLNPPTQWPLEDRMRVYIKKDLVAQAGGLALAGSQIADLKPREDAYAAKKIDLAPSRVIGANGGLNAPRNLVVAVDGTIYAADSGSARIVHYSADGQVLQSWGSQTPKDQTPPAAGTFNEPWGIALDGQGNVYVTDTWNHRVQKFDAQGKFLLQWGTGGLSTENPEFFWGPRGIVVGPGGNVYVTDTGNRRVAVFDPQGKYLFAFATEGDAALNEPVGITAAPDGRILVADTWNNRVAIFTAEGKLESSWPVQSWYSASITNKPFLALDSAGKVYVTDPEAGRVLVFSGTGEPLAAFGLTGGSGGALNLPTGIAAGPEGQIWVADAGNNRLVAYPALKP